MNARSRWQPVCLAVQVDEGIDAAAVKQWLQSRQNLKAFDLSEQGFASATGPIADFVTAEKEASGCKSLLSLLVL